MLRAYRDGKSGKLNPGHFSDNGWQCAIDHQVESVAHIRFGHRYGNLPQNSGTLPATHSVNMMVSPIPPFTSPRAIAIRM